MRKLLCAFFAVGLISAAACGGSKKTAATPDKAMTNAGGSDTMAGSGSGSGSGMGSGSGSAMNPCNGGGAKSPAPDPCSGAE